MKLIHAADLHLSSSEKEYSLAVLTEVVEIAKRERADYLLLAGDVFDTYRDAGLLKDDFAKIIKGLGTDCEVFFLAGNHEALKRKSGEVLLASDLGLASENLIDLDAAPFRLITRPGIEFLAIPHQKDYRTYPEWEVPPKKGEFRIGLAHALNSDLAFAGISEEDEPPGVLDSDLARRFGLDYLALGHIHQRSQVKLEGAWLAYAGSARVWRRGEEGPRSVMLLESENGFEPVAHQIKRAGEYRQKSFQLDLEGQAGSEVETWIEGAGENDWLELEFVGLVEELGPFESYKDRLRQEYAKNFRVFKLVSDQVEDCLGIAQHEVARRFLKFWEEARPADLGEAQEAWLLARQLGLKKLKDRLGRRQ